MARGKFRSVVFATVLAVVSFLSPGPANAQWFSCKTCDVDAYGQAVCVEFAQIGPEGYVRCFAYSWGCSLSQPCVWA